MNCSRCVRSVRSAVYGRNDVKKWGWKTSPFLFYLLIDIIKIISNYPLPILLK